MGGRVVEDMGELFVLAGLSLRMLQNQLASFLGVSDRTMRRWQSGGARLLPSTLHRLVHALHPKDPALAARFAAAHGRDLEVLLRLPAPAEATQRVHERIGDVLLRNAARAAGVPPRAMRAALQQLHVESSHAGLSLEEAFGLMAGEPRE
jgi:transcriptional regulator with XRE-family HTH domain